MKVLLHVSHPGLLRNFESTVRLLGARGHEVHIASERMHKQTGKEVDLEGLARDVPTITIGTGSRQMRGPWAKLSPGSRLLLDYLRYQDPPFSDVPRLRERAPNLLPRQMRPIAESRALRSPTVRRVTSGVLQQIAEAAPVDAKIARFIERQRVDVVAVTPLIYSHPWQFEYIRAARSLGIPSVALINSWDNLTTKGFIRDLPDLVVVWNDAQRREAIELHGLPEDRIEVTGAGAFDQWFGREPSRTREEFCDEVGLPADRPIVLWLGSSRFLAPDEPRFALTWARALRARGQGMDELAILARPHPLNPFSADPHAVAALHALGGTSVWPPDGAIPITERSRNDYFDTLFHCDAVAGLNTSAFIEASILGKAVHTVLDPRYEDSQLGMPHFSHLLREQGGMLHVSATLEEHFDGLEKTLTTTGTDPAAAAFVRRFVRPHGLEQPATPLMADAIERLATSRPPSPPRTALGHRALRAAITRTAPPLLASYKRRHPVEKQEKERQQGPRVLAVMPYPGYMRYYDTVLQGLAERGYAVHVAFELPHKQREGLRALRGYEDRITTGEVPRVPRHWKAAALDVRRATDYLRYLTPELAPAAALRARAADVLAPHLRPLRWLEVLPGSRAVSVARRWCAALERAIPSHASVEQYLEEQAPAAVFVSPLVTDASRQNDLVKAARTKRIPVIAGIASWDNLTNKGLMRVRPDRVVVWNEFQRLEASRLHDIDPRDVVVTGAQCFDRWFTRQPTARPGFLERVGLPAHAPMLLYVGATASISTPELEVGFVQDWLEALRTSGEAQLECVGVLVRPHPYNSQVWTRTSLNDRLGPVVVHPPAGANPVDEEDRQDYFDSLYHATAVVGVNTSAMVEAAVVGTPVLTVRLPRFLASQEQTMHFHYLLAENGGPVRDASSLEAHLAQLKEVLQDPEEDRERLRTFTQRFVRPHGLDEPAAPRVIQAIEEAAHIAPRPPAPGSRTLRRLVGAYGAVRLWTRRKELAKMIDHRASRLRKNLERRGMAIDSGSKRLAEVILEVGHASGGELDPFERAAERVRRRGLTTNRRISRYARNLHRRARTGARRIAPSAPKRPSPARGTRDPAEPPARPRETSIGSRKLSAIGKIDDRSSVAP